jgi:hypothetical protein
LVASLPFVLGCDQFLCVRALGSQPPLQPFEHGLPSNIESAQAVEQLGDERTIQLFLSVDSILQYSDELVWSTVKGGKQLVSQIVRLLASLCGSQHACGYASQIVQEPKAKQQWNSPQFADGEVIDWLVGLHECGDRLFSQAAVSVSDQLEPDVEHTR